MSYEEMPNQLRDYLIAKGDIKDYQDDFDHRVRPPRIVPPKIDWSLHFDRMRKILDEYIGHDLFPVPENEMWGELLEKLEELREDEISAGP